jgi:hypothetical protein
MWPSVLANVIILWAEIKSPMDLFHHFGTDVFAFINLIGWLKHTAGNWEGCWEHLDTCSPKHAVHEIFIHS